MSVVVSLSLALLALIHALPVVGVLGPRRLTALYGVEWSDADTLVLLRHRAVLFGVVAALSMLAVVRSELQWVALGLNLISIGAFVVLARDVTNAHLKRVVRVDGVGLVVVVVGLAGKALESLR